MSNPNGFFYPDPQSSPQVPEALAAHSDWLCILQAIHRQFSIGSWGMWTARIGICRAACRETGWLPG